jgi:hypothetical protein
MRLYLRLLRHVSNRLDRRTRRILAFCYAIGMMLFALTTVAAVREGEYPDAAAGLLLLAALAIASAMAWSAPHTRR